MKRLVSLLLILLLLAPLAAACSNEPNDKKAATHSMAPLVQMPSNVQQARSPVRQAYQFAAHNEGLLSALPCYCGCSAMGHLSNYDCYVSGTDESGRLTYDDHAMGCQICVDITHDAMRMLDEGQSVDEIYAYVNDTYGSFGPATPLK